MSFINKYLRNFEPYKTASHKIWLVSAEERKEILKLDWNEATIPPSPKVYDRLHKLLDHPNFFNLYPQTYNDDLLVLLSKYIGLPKENIQYFASSDSLHEYIAKLYIAVGDPVLILGPSYDNFRLTTEVCGGKIYYHNIDDSFKFDPEKFEQDIKDIEPSLVYICNPNNPTGTVHSETYIASLINKYKDTLFLIDEAYAEFSGSSVKNLVLNYENIVITRTMSKAFALANFRFGYLLASQKNIQYISKIRNAKNITTFTQEAVMGALSDVAYMENYVKNVNSAKEYFVKSLINLPYNISVVNGEGNFTLVILENAEVKLELMEYLNEQKIYVRDLSQTEFLKERCIRITIGEKKDMEQVVKAIENFFVMKG